jgi:hypothetical protein
MRSDTLRWDPGNGWSAPFPPAQGDRTLILVFAHHTVADHPQPITDLRNAYPQSVIAGVSTSAHFTGDELHSHGMTVTVTTFPTTRLRARTYRVSDLLAHGLPSTVTDPDQPARLALVLADARHVNGDDLVSRIRDGLGPDVAVYGGLAGDGSRFTSTWTLAFGYPATGHVTVITFYGDRLEVTSGSRGGWTPFGPARVVTGSTGTVVHTLDGRPAADVYRRYLGPLADDMPRTSMLFPLQVDLPDGGTVVRTVVAQDDDGTSMTFAGGIPEGATAHLMRANRDTLITGAAAAGTDAAPAGPTALTVIVSCVGRLLALGERAEEELEAAVMAMPAQTTIAGFYSHGEIAAGDSGRTELHNQTMTVLTLRELP